MDQKFTSTKLGTIVSGVALAAMGIILFTNPQSAMLTITVMLGWVLVVMGIVSLASALTRWSVILSTADLYAGIVELLFGILLVNIPGFFVTWIFILLGIFILVSGLNSLYGANALQALGLPSAGTAKVGAILAIVLGIFIWYAIFRTSFGFKIRAVGMNPIASRVNGFPVRRLVLLAFILSGAIAGLGGAVELLGKTPYRLADGFGSGFGFDGVAIALIAQLNPIAAIFVAFFFGVLSTGGTMMQSVIGVPTAIVEIIRGLIIIFAVAGMAAVKLPKIKAYVAARQDAKAKKAEVNA